MTRLPAFLTDSSRASWLTLWALVVFWLVISVIVPREASWDVLHYHIHNGWAFWNDRLDVDVAPAEMHTYLNPYYNALWWPVIESLPGRWVAFLLGAVQTLGLITLYLFCRAVFRRMGQDRPWMALMVTVTGFVCANTFTLLGSIRNDHLGPTLFCLSLWIVLRRAQVSWRSYALAALWLGLLFGLKLTNAVYVLGFAVFVVIYAASWTDRIKHTAASAAGGVAGIVIGGGPWFWAMWQRFHNPIYPFMETVFNPVDGPVAFTRDERHLPGGPLDLIVRPVTASFDGAQINEFAFTDWRLLLGFVASLGILGYLAATRRQDKRSGDRMLIGLALSFIVMLYAWLHVWSIARYAQALWMIGPLLAVALAIRVRPIILSRPIGWGLIGAAMVALIVTTVPPKTRRGHWDGEQKGYSWAQVPQDLDYDNALVVFTGHYPGAFLAAYFPPEARFTYILGPEWSREAMPKVNKDIDWLLQTHPGPIYAVINEQSGFAETLSDLDALTGLEGEAFECRRIRSGFDGDDVYWKICPVRR